MKLVLLISDVLKNIVQCKEDYLDNRTLFPGLCAGLMVGAPCKLRVDQFGMATNHPEISIHRHLRRQYLECSGDNQIPESSQ